MDEEFRRLVYIDNQEVMRREVMGLTKFEVLQRITDVQKFSELVFDMTQTASDESAFYDLLTNELTEKELQTVRSIAQTDYPLSFERKQ